MNGVRALLLAGLCLCAVPAEAAEILTLQGLGPVRIGMTHAQVESALDRKVALDSAASGNEERCATAARSDGKATFLFERYRLTAISVWKRGSDATTAEGAGLGTTDAQLRKLYDRAVFAPHPQDNEHGRYVTVKFPVQNRSLIFETMGGKVTSFRIGYPKSVEYIESCS